MQILDFELDRQTVTGNDGSYAFADVPAGGEYQLSFRPPTSDFDSRDSSFALGLDAPAEVTMDLTTVSRRASLSGPVPDRLFNVWMFNSSI